MKRWLASLQAVFLLLCAVKAGAAENRSILIELDGDPKFDVVYHRALTNATGAVIAGLIGAGIQASIESEKDSKKREQIRPHVSEQVWRDVYVKTLNETLLAKGFEPVWVEGKQKPKDFKADVYLVLLPGSYGFRMVDSTTSLVSSYVEFEAIYSPEPITSRKKPAKEAFYVTSKKQASYEDLVKETAALNAEVEAVLALAARRLANKIIYNVK
jgi:hypothetical protein